VTCRQPGVRHLFRVASHRGAVVKTLGAGALDSVICLDGSGAGDLTEYGRYPCPVVPTNNYIQPSCIKLTHTMMASPDIWGRYTNSETKYVNTLLHILNKSIKNASEQ
jgi:hypothetical protein